MCHPFLVLTASLVAVALGVLLVAAVVGLVLQARSLREARERIAELEELEAAYAVEETSNGRAVKAAGLAVRTAVDAVTRVRSQGVRGMLLSSIDDFAAWSAEAREDVVRVADEDGNVTVLFTDIENSTALNDEIGDEKWVRLLDAHDELLHTYLDKHRGHVVKSQGDGYMVLFSTPELALNAALDVQRALNAKRQRSRQLRWNPIRVRIGLHTGTAIERDGDWFGRNVAKAARVAAMADGGEIMVSSETAARLSESRRWTLTQTEPVELKGLPGEHTLWLVEAA